ncbi:hypothetical protein ACHAXR_003860 [Thalassiosira sp. AJA248-18]
MMPSPNFLLVLTYTIASCLGPGALGFAPNSSARNTASSSPRLCKTAISNSRDQAEQCISESYPKFYWLLQQNPTALQRLHESKAGFAVFAPSDAAIDALGPERIQLLEAACNDPGLQQIASRMVSYHMVSAPMTAEIMATYNVVSTRVGELPVEVASDGALYVNGVRIIQSYQFEDRIVENYQDKDGNLLGSQSMEGGKRYIIHEVEGLVCPDELWHAMYAQFESAGANNVY